MQLEDYIKGSRHGKEANRLEREAMNDPFLQAALDGFDAVPGDPTETIERLKLKVISSATGVQQDENGHDAFVTPHPGNQPLIAPKSEHTGNQPLTAPKSEHTVIGQKNNRRTLVYWSAAATILLLIGFGTYFLLERNKPGESSIVMLQKAENERKTFSESLGLPAEPADESKRETVIDSEQDEQAMEILTESEQLVQARRTAYPAQASSAPPSGQPEALKAPTSSIVTVQPEATKPARARSMPDNSPVNNTAVEEYVAATVDVEEEADALFLSEVVMGQSEQAADYEESMEDDRPMALSSGALIFRGKVVDENGDPLPGVNILNKGTTGATTDINGRFSIQLSEKESNKLVTSYIGYKSKEIDLSDTNRIITLEEDPLLISEVVIVGYGTQKRNPLKRAVSAESARKNDAASNDANERFGEKEFQAYCRQKADKQVCDGKNITVKVSFFVDATGKPTQISYERFTCEQAKEEIERLLASSPAWTNTNRKVTMTVKW